MTHDKLLIHESAVMTSLMLNHLLDWTGNPNVEDLKRKNYPGGKKVPRWNGKWFELGPVGKNDVRRREERKKKCDMFDNLGEYMLH